jgi:nitrite reductase/ring-hydroxylating ferredoxin subunit
VSAAKTNLRVAFPKDELGPGDRRIVKLGRREVLVINDDGVLRALYNRCPHQRAPLTVGPIRSQRVVAEVGQIAYDPTARVLLCPWHRYEFELDTGRCPADPARLRVATYDVRVEGDEIAVYA